MATGYTLLAAPIPMPPGFFFSLASPEPERPNGPIYLVPLGGLSLTVGGVIGIGLVTV